MVTPPTNSELVAGSCFAVGTVRLEDKLKSRTGFTACRRYCTALPLRKLLSNSSRLFFT